MGVDPKDVKDLADVLKIDYGTEGRTDQRTAMWVFLTFALFATIYVLRLFDQDARNGIAFLYSLPVALVALRFGHKGGLASAGFAMHRPGNSSCAVQTLTLEGCRPPPER